jgi:hypothetical protein
VNIGGHRQRLYVAEKDLKTRLLYACAGRDHPGIAFGRSFVIFKSKLKPAFEI